MIIRQDLPPSTDVDLDRVVANRLDIAIVKDRELSVATSAAPCIAGQSMVGIYAEFLVSSHAGRLTLLSSLRARADVMRQSLERIVAAQTSAVSRSDHALRLEV